MPPTAPCSHGLVPIRAAHVAAGEGAVDREAAAAGVAEEEVVEAGAAAGDVEGEANDSSSRRIKQNPRPWRGNRLPGPAQGRALSPSKKSGLAGDRRGALSESISGKNAGA